MTDKTIPLGKEVSYPEEYDASLLFPVARQVKRDELGLDKKLPFHGSDFWNGYELSWLNKKGKPQVAIGVFEFAHDTANIVESKSFKLYLNSFNQARFQSWEEVEKRLHHDLTKAANGEIQVSLYSLSDYQQKFPVIQPEAMLIDELDIEVKDYDYDANLLKTDTGVVSEMLQSDLLKSNCLITSQPDWATVFIEYKGQQINHESLLRYLISFRNHNEFHEQCVERIFTDIMDLCQPEELTVYARYTRRGGLDINPWRSNAKGHTGKNSRLVRQ
ncbi:NADPH-dependent 7-cyano-7-deazaguanine reductase QueF [Kangiella sediminilitoris]|uniref:NADPH-dependent 7-cyano-7-deazaguanine reductase n=1 Tax=Kangiella sediminilitoris TaxID=1144748 RepID=A0A1B3BC93_9GAMM|nr:NADPH-dependent 7-cyano-7-deazaguanine reductase QueF [Kangiella sediminilitoris]AOE50424.1 NADPH-dependent 7-cyano-7-deazaguanine reductase [Kangiella sediminilitoris]